MSLKWHKFSSGHNSAENTECSEIGLTTLSLQGIIDICKFCGVQILLSA